MQADSLVAALTATLSPDATLRRQATAFLTTAESQPDFAVSLLGLAESASLDPTLRLVAATVFRNLVRRVWNSEEEGGLLSPAARAAIKTNLVALLATAPPAVHRQVCERAWVWRG